jgi:two-component system, NarL family, nitrate/nitrite response regulator NarP
VRVLIADDNRLMLEGVRRALEPVEDIEIVGTTHTGSQVLGLVERRCPDLVALELGMRGADGRRCLELLREQHPDIKVVVLSASSARDDIREALTSGARAFIVKTVNPLDIPAALRHAYDETVHHAIGFEPSPEDQLRAAAGLTERELTMLQALARGLSNKAISRELWVSEETVKFHLGNLYRKLGVPNRLAAANVAHARGIAAA